MNKRTQLKTIIQMTSYVKLANNVKTDAAGIRELESKFPAIDEISEPVDFINKAEICCIIPTESGVLFSANCIVNFNATK